MKRYGTSDNGVKGIQRQGNVKDNSVRVFNAKGKEGTIASESSTLGVEKGQWRQGLQRHRSDRDPAVRAREREVRVKVA